MSLLKYKLLQAYTSWIPGKIQSNTDYCRVEYHDDNARHLNCKVTGNGIYYIKTTNPIHTWPKTENLSVGSKAVIDELKWSYAPKDTIIDAYFSNNSGYIYFTNNNNFESIYDNFSDVNIELYVYNSDGESKATDVEQINIAGNVASVSDGDDSSNWTISGKSNITFNNSYITNIGGRFFNNKTNYTETFANSKIISSNAISLELGSAESNINHELKNIFNGSNISTLNITCPTHNLSNKPNVTPSFDSYELTCGTCESLANITLNSDVYYGNIGLLQLSDAFENIHKSATININYSAMSPSGGYDQILLNSVGGSLASSFGGTVIFKNYTTDEGKTIVRTMMGNVDNGLLSNVTIIGKS